MVDPEDFKRKHLALRKIKADFYIINTWIKVTIPDIEERIFRKQRYLNSAIKTLIIVSICFGVNIVASSIPQ